jgi:hypothetical protein
MHIDSEKPIDASKLFFHAEAEKLSGLITEVVQKFGVTEEDAEALIEESASIYEVESQVETEDLADASWDIQKITAEAAKKLGFAGVLVEDEQGGAVMIDMIDRENDLTLVK